MIPERIDHIEQGLTRLPEQFRDKPNIEGLLKSWLTSVQTTEDRLFSLLNFRSVDTAIGVQLDNIGRLVGARRDGNSDERFRDRIILQILINNSEGNPKDLLEILSFATNGSIVKYYAHFPIEGNVYTNGSRNIPQLSSTLTSCAPVSHGQIHIYFDPQEDCLIPSELQDPSGILIDNDGNEIVDREGNNILVGGLGDNINQNRFRGVLAELGATSLSGIPCEISHR